MATDGSSLTVWQIEQVCMYGTVVSTYKYVLYMRMYKWLLVLDAQI